MKKRRHPFVRLVRLILALALLPLFYVAGVIGFAWSTDYQPAPTEEVEIQGSFALDALSPEDSTLVLFNWNIGYGGLGAKSDFWKDQGTMVHSPRELATKYLNGITLNIAKYRDSVDFFLLQEVDQNSARSYHVDQVAAIASGLEGYGWMFGKNYDVKYIPVPFLEPYGGVKSGLTTFGKVKPRQTIRYSFEGNYSFPTGLFYLDRCFLLSRYPLANQKELVIINTHNSAYDDGSLKKRQMIQMAEVLRTEYEKGNYVIVGGDWNQMPPGFPGLPNFPAKTGSGMEVPAVYPDSGWTWAWDPETPTNRALAAPFDQDTTPRTVIDFYLLSPNLNLKQVKTIDLNFEFSDHQPVLIEVSL